MPAALAPMLMLDLAAAHADDRRRDTRGRGQAAEVRRSRADRRVGSSR